MFYNNRIMNKTIFLADDDKQIRAIFAEVFSEAGRLIIAADGQEALKVLQTQAPALAFLDVDMPGLTGLEVLEKARGCCPETAFWILTAHEDLQTVTLAMSLGAAGYLTKPFEITRLRDIVRDAFEEKSSKPWSVKKPEGGECP
jgi:DNA-binding NtrC family response regulator